MCTGPEFQQQPTATTGGDTKTRTRRCTIFASEVFLNSAQQVYQLLVKEVEVWAEK